MISFESWRPAPERRSYTGDVLAYFHAEATGRTAQAATTGALQTAAGLLARAFSAAMPTGDLGLLTPFVLADIGFDLMRRGESVWLFQVDADGPALLRAGRTAGAAVQGTADPRTWRYVAHPARPRLDPHGQRRRRGRCCISGSTRNPSTPWRGRSPIELGPADRPPVRQSRGCAREGSRGAGRARRARARWDRAGHGRRHAVEGRGPEPARPSRVSDDDGARIRRRRVERSSSGLARCAGSDPNTGRTMPRSIRR